MEVRKLRVLEIVRHGDLCRMMFFRQERSFFGKVAPEICMAYFKTLDQKSWRF